MAAVPRKSFFGLLFSTPTLAPVFLGLLGTVLVLLFGGHLGEQRQHKLAAFLAVVGALGGAGMLLTLLLSRRGLDPALVRQRQELLDCLKELAERSHCAPSAEADQPAVAAQTERVCFSSVV
jgi:hypothetical protein